MASFYNLISSGLLFGAALAQFDSGLVIETVTSDSASCTNNCLSKDRVFCRNASDRAEGICCDPDDRFCIENNQNGICSNKFSVNGYKIFSCPFEEDICGRIDQYTLPSSGDNVKIVSKQNFISGKVCYYEVKAPVATEGSLMLIEFVGIYKTESVVSMGTSLNDQDAIFCNLEPGQIVIAPSSTNFYISFKAEASSSSRFYINARYANSIDDIPKVDYVNKFVCSDGGSSIEKLAASGGSSGGNPALTDDDFLPNEQDTETVIKFAATSINERKYQEDQALQRETLYESFDSTATQSSMTFNSLLLTVSFLLIVTSILVFVNIGSTKSRALSLAQQEQDLRDARRIQGIQQMNRGTSSSEEESDDASNQQVQSQAARIASLNAQLAQRSGNGQRVQPIREANDMVPASSPQRRGNQLQPRNLNRAGLAQRPPQERGNRSVPRAGSGLQRFAEQPMEHIDLRDESQEQPYGSPQRNQVRNLGSALQMNNLAAQQNVSQGRGVTNSRVHNLSSNRGSVAPSQGRPVSSPWEAGVQQQSGAAEPRADNRRNQNRQQRNAGQGLQLQDI